jgi:FtsH-binding integral membrane protein
MSWAGSVPVARLDEQSRHAFLVRTYGHLFGAIVLFTLIEAALFASGLALPIAQAMLGTSWLIVLGAFMLVSWFATRTAATAVSPVAQYAALIGFVFAEAILFLPLLAVANYYAPGTISSAAMVTLGGFGLLTGMMMWTKQDLGFLGGLLRWIGILAMVMIAASLLFGFKLGTFFSVAMVGFAGAAILYDTSEVMHRYPRDRHVAAALQLFASVAMMFWYVLRLFLGSRED